MLETILIIVGFNACLLAGGVSGMLNSLKRGLCFLCIGIGGFFFCWFSGYPLQFVFWGAYMFGFIIVVLMRRQRAKELFDRAVADAMGEDYNCISVDKNGNPKVTYLKVIEGGNS